MAERIRSQIARTPRLPAKSIRAVIELSPSGIRLRLASA
jgi:hypothetical protein